ncbi:MAG: heparinase II/III family protein [Planctomycetota bacterium]
MKPTVWVVICLCTLVLRVSIQADETKGNAMEERVKTIAPMLAERPAAFGRPITDRAAWDALAKHAGYKGVIRSAEGFLTAPIPDLSDEQFLDFSRTGNRTRWQTISSRRQSRLAPLVLAECVENKGRFLKPIEEIIRVLCSERTWVYPAHDRNLTNFYGKSIDIDLRSASLAHDLATANFLLGDKLSAEVRQLIRDNLMRRVLNPYRDMVNGKRQINWWMKTTSNWNAVCLAGVTGAALATLESREGRAFFIAAAEEYSRNFLSGFPPDGYCTEGLGYWNYGFGHYVILSEAICQATSGGVDPMARPEVQEPAKFGARIEIMNGVYPAFADCGVNARPSADIMWFVSRRFRLGLRRWEEYDPVSPGGLYGSMMYSFPNSASKTPPAEAPQVDIGQRSWFNDAGILICRPGDRAACRMGVALKGGHNAEHHNHNDVGSYVVVVGQQAVLLDPGSEVYTGRTFSKDRYVSNVLNSYGHAVPLVAGAMQRTGRDACAKVIKTDFTDEADTFVIDIASAYPVPELKKLERTFIYSRKDAGSLTVTDTVEFAGPKDFATAIITLGRWKETEPGRLLIYDTEEAVRVDIKIEGAEYAIKAEEIKEDVHTPTLPTRIGINLTKPVTTATVTLTIRPAEQGGPLLRNGSFEEGTWGWQIREDSMGSLSNEQASEGKTSLKIVDRNKKDGSSITSARMTIEKVGPFELRGKVFCVSGDGVGLYMRYLDKDGNMLNHRINEQGWIGAVTTVTGPAGKWEPFVAPFTPPEGTKFLQLWIHSASTAITEAYLDELEIAPVTAR